MVKAIIFDLWETLGTKNLGISKSLQEKFGLPKDESFLVAYERSVQRNRWPDEDSMAKNFLTEFNLEQIHENVDFITSLFRKGINDATLFDGVLELLSSLRARGLKVGLLSNTTIFESVVVKNLGLEAYFDATVFSWQKGNLKPSEAAFKNILEELSVSRDEAVFIDDTKRNIEAAEKFGLHSIRFESVGKLKEDLHTLLGD